MRQERKGLRKVRGTQGQEKVLKEKNSEGGGGEENIKTGL